ncbi:MAG: Glyoxalase/bleomycin resistance protein/dioxygenase [Acidobacteriaceae bacterium]|nr:Glyoxalase/bleomycin resistance protein/dioxygenase [Acidobacteriaceae bacterium]
MSNPFVHLELNTPDLAKAKAFYGELFGWEFQDMSMVPSGIYSTFKPSEGPGGGMMSMPDGKPGWLSYVGVSNIQESTDKARALGATILMGPHPIPDVGSFTVLNDPTGCTIALFQAK